MRRALRAALVLATLTLLSCSRPAPLFVEHNARAHINMLAGTIGSRPAGTPANEKARAYIVDQLTLFGFTVRVQEVDARRAEFGRTAHVANIIGVLPGERPEGVGLVAHYDSGFDNPGAADDGFGVALALEAARSIAGRPGRRWTLFVLVTDAEETGLMGAAGLATDREIADRLKAYLNVEAAGSSDPVLLFETGPGNGWLVGPWARHAPHPRGASYGVEIYRRLPNDTDFSVLKRLDIPGLNFASVGNSYVYHTARDVPDGVPPRVLQRTGENIVAVVNALDSIDVTQRAGWNATYFDVAGSAAVSFGPAIAWTIAGAALLLGVLAFVRMAAAVIRLGGVARLVLALVSAAVAVLLAASAMVAVTWALRAAREVYHPWYARPDRLILLLAATGISVAWGVNRVGSWIPPGAHAPRHPALVWTLTFPLWIAFAVTALWVVPAAAYLWTIPLLSAGLLLSIAPRTSALAIRVASFVVFAVTAILWGRETVEMVRFIVAVFGRLPMVTPAFVYAGVLTMAGLMIAPPLIAAAAPAHPLLRPSLATALCLAAVAATAGFAYAAPAYTRDQPLRRVVRAVQEEGAGAAIWEVASTEPGLDLEAGAPPGWTIDATAPKASVPLTRLSHPFVFRTRGPSLGAAPARIAAVTRTPVEGGIELAVTVVPLTPGLAVAFVAPPNVTPARSNLPGVRGPGRWRATYVAPQQDGIVWRAAFAAADVPALYDVRVVVSTGRFPGGAGWQQLPAWLPQEQTVWSGSAMWVLAASAPTVPAAPVEPAPLRWTP